MTALAIIVACVACVLLWGAVRFAWECGYDAGLQHGVTLAQPWAGGSCE